MYIYRSSTTIESPYVFCEEMRTLSRPRTERSTMNLSLARITNVLFSTEEVPVKRTHMARETYEKRNEIATYHMASFW